MKLKDPEDNNRLNPVAFRLMGGVYFKLKVLSEFYRRSMAAIISELVEKASRSAQKSNPEAYREAEKEASKPTPRSKKK